MLLWAGAGTEPWGSSVSSWGSKAANPPSSLAFFAISPTSLALAEIEEVWSKERKFPGRAEEEPRVYKYPQVWLGSSSSSQESSCAPAGLPGRISPAWKTPLATATSSCSAGREGAPTAPQHPALVPSTPVCPARSSPLGDRHWGILCGFQGDFGHGDQLLMDVSPF